MSSWRVIDRQADWIRDVFDPTAQMRLGVIMTDVGIAITFLVKASGEPPLIFVMSSLALIFGGIGVVVTAKLAEDTEETVENTEVCCYCGKPPSGKD